MKPFRLALTLLPLILCGSSSFGQVGALDFISMDGTLEHHFEPSGDYSGKVSGFDGLMLECTKRGLVCAGKTGPMAPANLGT